MKKGIIGLVVIVLLGLGFVKVKDYYDARYVEEAKYYVLVPESQSTEIEDLFDDSGKVVDKGKNYKFVGMNEKGETKVVTFSYTTKDPSKLLQPGTYLEVSSSKQIVLGQHVISESEVPSSILSKLKDLN